MKSFFDYVRERGIEIPEKESLVRGFMNMVIRWQYVVLVVV